MNLGVKIYVMLSNCPSTSEIVLFFVCVVFVIRM